MLTPRLLRTSQVLVLISVDGEDRIYDLRLLAIKGMTLGLIQHEGSALDTLIKQAQEDVIQSKFSGESNRSYSAVYELAVSDNLRLTWCLKRSVICDSNDAIATVLPS